MSLMTYLTVVTFLMILCNLCCFWIVVYAYRKEQLSVWWVLGIGPICLLFIVINIMSLTLGAG